MQRESVEKTLDKHETSSKKEFYFHTSTKSSSLAGEKRKWNRSTKATTAVSTRTPLASEPSSSLLGTARALEMATRARLGAARALEIGCSSVLGVAGAAEMPARASSAPLGRLKWPLGPPSVSLGPETLQVVLCRCFRAGGFVQVVSAESSFLITLISNYAHF